MSGEQSVALRHDRARFLQTGSLDRARLPGVVAASWVRSRSAGVNAEDYRVPYHPDVETDSRLIRCAIPVLRTLREDLAGTPASVALADAKARIVYRRDSGQDVGRRLDKVDFNPGFDFGEGGVGTNGVGTVLEAGEAVNVVGAAHFQEALTPFACIGVPILDPILGRAAGILDISLLAGDWSPLLPALARRAAADIGERLVADRSQALQLLFRAFVQARARGGGGVIAIGGMNMFDDRARTMFSAAELDVLLRHGQYRSERRGCEEVDLGGDRIARVRITPVAGCPGGAVLVVSPSYQGGQEPVATVVGTVRRTVEGDATPAMRSVAASVRQAFESGRVPVLTGEPGSGRARCLAGAHRALHAEVEVLQLHAQDASRWSEAAAVVDGYGLVVLTEVQRWPAEAVGEWMAALAALPQPPAVAATCGPDDGVASGDVFAQFGADAVAVEVPPLRHRGADIPALAEAVLRELAPGRKVSLDERAVRALVAHPWPGNLTQLRQVLADALAARPVGQLDLNALPAQARATRKVLTPVELAECDTIVAALAAAEGNKLQAARALGMSRSSLYRKVDRYGIQDL
ncbi:sigma-54-dependent Fis family transcriptional regulator [Dermacoccaceae bacterium W4C1]